MADVFVAEQAQLGRRVVIKVLHPHLARDTEVAERFRREAEAAAKLVHPYITRIFDYGATDDVVFTVMPFLEGRIAGRPDPEGQAGRSRARRGDAVAGRVRARLRAPPGRHSP